MDESQKAGEMRTLELKEARTLYDVELDVEARTGEPVRVTSGGEVVGVLVSESEYEAFRQWQEMRHREAKMRERYKLFEEEAAAFQRLLPDLLETQQGRVVAIHGGEVIEIGDSKADVSERVHRRLGDVVVYIQRVEEQPRVYKIPSPRLVR